MKKLLAILLGLAFAAVAAEAKTYYVDATRPNNNGNGLKPATAKRTIQAAVNIAQNGDTILVYPGWYSPIKTNDKKITIKSVKGASKTGIAKPASAQPLALAQLGKTYSIKTTDGTYSAAPAPLSKGANTLLSGFLLDGLNRSNGYYDLIGVSGGRAASCCIQRLGHTTVQSSGGYSYTYNDCATAAANARLASCVLRNNKYVSSGSGLLVGCTLQRCKIQANVGLGYGSGEAISSCKLYNCLVTGNASDVPLFTSSLLLNCTVSLNAVAHTQKTGKFSVKSKYLNCILRNNVTLWQEETVTHPRVIHNVDSGNTYSRTYTNNRDPKFANAAKGDFRLRTGSPCIDQGRLNATLKQLVGSYDLSGKKRIRGKNIDMGCCEY